MSNEPTLSPLARVMLGLAAGVVVAALAPSIVQAMREARQLDGASEEPDPPKRRPRRKRRAIPTTATIDGAAVEAEVIDPEEENEP